MTISASKKLKAIRKVNHLLLEFRIKKIKEKLNKFQKSYNKSGYRYDYWMILNYEKMLNKEMKNAK